MTRMPRSLALAAALVALLAGCVAIPTSGAVETARLDTDPEESPNVALVEGPGVGQTPVDLLKGFIRAGRAPQNGYSVAREYLTSEATWSGTERVLVTSSAILPVAVDEDTVGLTVTVIGEVDARGVYTARAPQAQTLTYDFEVVGGEYRISRADPGTVLSRNGFDTAFEGYPLYFFDLTFGSLVADLRWFPETRSVAGRIVDELLLGPAGWLASPVVVSAFPAGTTGETIAAAPQVDIDLDAAVRAESPVVQLRMTQQLTASLAALGNITDIEVTAGGLSLSPADPGDTAPTTRYTVREAIGGVGGAFGAIADGGVTALPVIGSRADSLQPSAASLSRDRRSAAVRGPAGVWIVPPSGAAVLVDARPGLVAPSLDPYGFAWTAPSDDPGGLRATGVDVVAHPIALPIDGTVVSIDVSRDGTRLLVALNTPSGPRVALLGIQRDADLVPIGFGAVYDLPVIGAVVDAAWVDQVSVAVLHVGEESTEVDVYPLGGPIRELGDVEDAIQLVGGDDVSGIRVLSADGSLHQPSSAGGWIRLELVASFLGTQQ